MQVHVLHLLCLVGVHGSEVGVVRLHVFEHVHRIDVRAREYLSLLAALHPALLALFALGRRPGFLGNRSDLVAKHFDLHVHLSGLGLHVQELLFLRRDVRQVHLHSLLKLLHLAQDLFHDLHFRVDVKFNSFDLSEQLDFQLVDAQVDLKVESGVGLLDLGRNELFAQQVQPIVPHVSVQLLLRFNAVALKKLSHGLLHHGSLFSMLLVAQLHTRVTLFTDLLPKVLPADVLALFPLLLDFLPEFVLGRADRIRVLSRDVGHPFEARVLQPHVRRRPQLDFVLQAELRHREFI